MKLLLDTHIWIWSVLEPTRLSGRVARAIDDLRNELWLSPISVWELLMLVQKARLQLNEGAAAWAVRTIEQLQLHEATLTTEVALETSKLDLPHSDPSDRLIAASAKVFDLTLVTADTKLISVPGIRVLANR
jgi:PIN domain nuclease of toxin-antitoxin system